MKRAEEARVTGGGVVAHGPGRKELAEDRHELEVREPFQAFGFGFEADKLAGGTVAACLWRCPQAQRRRDWPLMHSGF